MSRKTKYIVYVDKEVMTKPSELVDAVLSHLIKKDMDIRERKQFLAKFMKAAVISEEDALEVIHAWVQVRDVADFPFRKEAQNDIKGAKPEGMVIDEDTEVEGGVPVDDGAGEESESGASSD